MNPIMAKAYGLLLGAALAAAGVPVGPGSLTSRAVVSYGHQGAVRDLSVDDPRGLVFSAGEDGTLRIWDAESQTLIHRIAITRQKVLSIAVDPAASFAAVVVTDGAKAYWADVWNWDTGELLYRLPLDAAPTFAHFSLTGTYLLLGTMTWDSLRIYRASDGKRLDAPDEGGMVGFAEVSRSDSTLMTYRLSGSIEYQEMASGQVVKQVSAAPYLLDIRASGDRRYIAGHSDQEVVCVDALTGETRLRLPAAGVVSLDISDQADRIVWVTSDGTVHTWSESGETPSTAPVTGLQGWHPLLLRFDGRDLLVGGSDGEIVRVSPSGESARLAQDIMARTSAVAEADTVLSVAAGSILHVFQVTPRLAELFSMPSPFGKRPVGLLAMDDQHILCWPRDDGPVSMGIIDCTTRTFSQLGAAFSSPLLGVAYRDGRVYTLEDGGRILVTDLASGRTVFETTRPGAVCLSPAQGNVIVVGKGQTGTLESALMLIEMNTGETVPIPGAETFTYALAPDPLDGSLYSLGVGADGQTRVYRHSGHELADETVEDTGDADLSASLALDPSSGILYSSLGRQRVTAWSDGALRTIGAPSPGIVALRARNGLLAALQLDSTVTLWDLMRDRPVGRLYPFSDGSWAAIMADGSVQGVASGIAKVGFFAQGKLEETPSVPPSSQEHPVVP